MTWPLVALSLLGNVLVIRKNRWGYFLWIVSNTGWGTVAALSRDWPQVTLWGAYLALALWGWWSWSRRS